MYLLHQGHGFAHPEFLRSNTLWLAEVAVVQKVEAAEAGLVGSVPALACL
jgi:hypothetical protein